MIQRLREILECGNLAGEELCRLTDEFRESRNSSDLIEALDSDSERIIGLAVYILKEIPTSKYDNREIINRLEELTAHQNPAIRFQSLNALSPLLRADSPKNVDLLARMQRDENEGVQIIAKAAAVRLGIGN